MHFALPAVPIPVLPEFASWRLLPDGTFAPLAGPGADRIRGRIGMVAGRHYEEVSEGYPEERAFFRRALEGRVLAERITTRTGCWFMVARPEWDAGVFLGVEGTSFLLPEDVEPEGGLGRCDAEVYELAGDRPGDHCWSGDRFVVRPDRETVTLLRTLPRCEWEAIRDADPVRMHAIRACASRPAPPPLRLLP